MTSWKVNFKNSKLFPSGAQGRREKYADMINNMQKGPQTAINLGEPESDKKRQALYLGTVESGR